MIDVVMPQMGVSVTEGTVVRWLRRAGEQIGADEPLLEISTDKVDTEVPSPAAGVIAEILVQEGETVAVGSIIARIGAKAGAAPAAPLPSGNEGPRVFVSPVVARIAGEHGLDVRSLSGTGRGGRLTKKDILEHVAMLTAAPASEVEHLVPSPAPQPPLTPPAPPEPSAALPGETAEPLSVMRRAIAEHMVRSVATSAHVMTAFEVDMSRVVQLRSRLKSEYLPEYGVSLTYLPFVCRAVVDALQKWPWLNGELRGETVVTRTYVNLGIAVALDDGKGLIVPNIKHAEELNLLGIARAIADLASRARSKKLRPEDVQDGTFTVTNPGGWGSFVGTPIINQPQVGILDVEALVKRPWVVQDAEGNDAIAIRPIMNLSLSFDHRLIDGAYAAQFMKQVRDTLQGWGDDFR